MFSIIKIGLRATVAVLLLQLAYGCGQTSQTPAEYLTSARQHMEANEPELAGVALKNLLAIEPGNTEALLLFADSNEAREDFNGVFSALRQVTESDPENYQGHLRLGQLLTVAGNLKAAEPEILRAEQLDPENTETLALRTTWLLQSGEVAEASVLAEKNLAANEHDQNAVILAVMTRQLNRQFDLAESLLQPQPKGESTWDILRVQLARAQGRYSDIPIIFQRLIRSHPNDVAYCQELAEHYVSAEEESLAVQALEECVERNPDNIAPKLLLAGLLARTNEDLAINSLRTFIEQEPQQEDLRFALARLYIDTDQLEYAIKQYEAIASNLSKDASVTEAQIQLARLALENGRQAEALELINTILERDANHPNALILQSYIEVQEGDPAIAIATLRQVLRDQPRSAPALELMGRAYVAHGSTSLGMESFQSALSIDPLHQDAALGLTTLLIAAGRFDQVESVLGRFEAAQQLTTEMEQSLLQTRLVLQDWGAARRLATRGSLGRNNPVYRQFVNGLAQLHTGQFKQAIETLTALAQARPAARSVLAALLSAYAKSGQNESAIAFLQAFRTTHPDIPWLDRFVVQQYRELGSAELAMSTLQQWVDTETAKPEHFNLLASMLVNEKPSEALSMVRRGRKAFPEAVTLTLSEAELLERTGQKAAAAATYEAVLAAQPKAQAAINNLAVLYSQSEETMPKALALVANLEGTRQPYFADTVGWTYYLGGRPEQALKPLQFAVESLPTHAEVNYHIGATYLALKDTGNAKKYLSKARELLDSGQSMVEEDQLNALLRSI